MYCAGDCGSLLSGSTTEANVEKVEYPGEVWRILPRHWRNCVGRTLKVPPERVDIFLDFLTIPEISPLRLLVVKKQSGTPPLLKTGSERFKKCYSQQALLRGSIEPNVRKFSQRKNHSFPSCTFCIYTSGSVWLWASICNANLPTFKCLVQFLFVRIMVCLRLPSDSASRRIPLSLDMS